jgi:hypothetical protein
MLDLRPSFLGSAVKPAVLQSEMRKGFPYQAMARKVPDNLQTKPARLTLAKVNPAKGEIHGNL